MLNQRRRRFLVDKRLQFAIAAQILGVVAGMALLYVLGLFVLPAGGGLVERDPEELRALLLRTNLIYFLLGSAILAVATILITHRLAGPAFVIRRVVDAMRRGVFDERLKLRRRDYFKPLAHSVRLLRDELCAQRERRTALLARLSRCIEGGDVDTARDLVAQLRDRPAETPDDQLAQSAR